MPAVLTNVKPTAVVESAHAMVDVPPPRVYTMDNLMIKLAGGEPGGAVPLANAMLWDYLYNFDVNNISVYREAMSLNVVKKQPKYGNIQELTDTFWTLHSRYLRPSASEVRTIYEDVLGHVAALRRTYGDRFLVQDSIESKNLVDRLAAECGARDEVEENRREHAETLNRELRKGDVGGLIGAWFTRYGNVPDGTGDLAARVAPEMIDGWYFRKDGVLDYCVKLISDFLERRKIETSLLEDVIAYDFQNRGKYKFLKSCVLLGSGCEWERYPNVKLSPDWWADKNVRRLMEQPGSHRGIHNAVTGLFIFSDVDTGFGATFLMEQQSQKMSGRDKTESSYDLIKRYPYDDTSGFPPWRTADGAWPPEAIMEAGNYQTLDVLLREVDAPVEIRGKAKRYREDAPEKPVKQEQAATAKKQKVAEPPVAEELPQTTEKETDGPNYPLWGGLAAITVGVGAIAFSRRR